MTDRPLYDAILVGKGEEIVGYTGRVELRDGPDYGHVRDVQPIRRARKLAHSYVDEVAPLLTQAAAPSNWPWIRTFLLDLAVALIGVAALLAFLWWALTR